MTGRRVYPNTDGSFKLERGDYIHVDGHWYCRVPDDDMNDMDLGCLDKHQIVEHEDGTISVTPSILQHGRTPDWRPRDWHGFLTRGEWKEC